MTLLLLSSAYFVGAQFIAPSSPRLPILPRSTNASFPHCGSASTVNLSPLNATLTELPVTIANKRLTETLSPLNATLTKNPGGAVDTEAVLFES